MTSIYEKAMLLQTEARKAYDLEQDAQRCCKIHGCKHERARAEKWRTLRKTYDIDHDVHTRHCCKLHGCKYGDDEFCTVMTTDHPGMTEDCQTCFDDQIFDGYEDKYEDEYEDEE